MRQVLDASGHETWRPVLIHGGKYAARYQVSDLGHVRANPDAPGQGRRPGRVLSEAPNSGGYLQVRLYQDAKAKMVKLHRVVAEVFLGPRPEGMTINHIDGDKTNNAAANLEYVTHKDNNRHAWRTTRPTKTVFYGERMSVTEAVDRFAIPEVNERLVWSRIGKGWDPEAALTTPKLKPYGRTVQCP